MVEFAVSAPAITCDIDVFGRLGNTAAEYQRIGLSDLSGRLRAAGISSAAVRKIATLAVVLVMADKSSSLYFLELDTRYEGIRDDLQSIGVEELAFGKTHLLAVGADRRVRSAGCNANAQLGLGSAPDDKGNHALAVVPKVHDVMAVACGDRHSVALTRRGDVYTWGSSEHGQCAGLRLIHLSPFVVVGLPPIASIACGDDFTVALAAGSGSVWTFGGNQCGQLGHGRRSTCERRPRSVPLFRAATRIAAGSAHALVLDVDGTVYAWG